MVTVGVGCSIGAAAASSAGGSSGRGSFEKNWANSSAALGVSSSSALRFWCFANGRSAIPPVSTPPPISLSGSPCPLVTSQPERSHSGGDPRVAAGRPGARRHQGPADTGLTPAPGLKSWRNCGRCHRGDRTDGIVSGRIVDFRSPPAGAGRYADTWRSSLPWTWPPGGCSDSRPFSAATMPTGPISLPTS